MAVKFIKAVILTVLMGMYAASLALADPAADALSPYYNLNLSVPTDRYSAYDPTKSLINPVQNQGNYGTCWAFATVASVESNIYKQFQQNGTAYNVETEPVKLSPWYLAWITSAPPTKVNALDIMDYAGMPNEGTYFRPFAQKIYDAGTPLNLEYALTLGHDFLEIDPHDPNALVAPEEYTEGTIVRLKNLLMVTELQKPENIQKIKNLIATYGAPIISINANAWSQEGAIDFYRPEQLPLNHSVSLIGWDDNYDFSQSHLRVKPKNKGAWIIRNTWGAEWADKGDCYLSYEDASTALVFSLDMALDTEEYYYNYITSYENTSHYDNSYIAEFYTAQMPPNSAFAANYLAEEDVLLQAVGFYALTDGMHYAINVYKNCPDFLNNRPEPAYHQEGTFGEDGTSDCNGYRTVDLKEPVALSENEEYVVEIALTAPDGNLYFGVAVETNKINRDKVYSYIKEGDEPWQKVLDQEGTYQNENFREASVIQRAYLKRI